MDDAMDAAVRSYVDAIPDPVRAAFDRVHEAVLRGHPDVEVMMSYQMPTYRLGRRRLHVGAWRHGLSIYGWDQARNAAFARRHPGLLAGRGTLRLGTDDLADLSDDELAELIDNALAE